MRIFPNGFKPKPKTLGNNKLNGNEQATTGKFITV